jgi:hypothetical protein
VLGARSRVASEGGGLEGLKRTRAPVDRGMGLRSPGGPKVITAVDLGQPRTEALQVGLGLLDFLIRRPIPVALAAQLVEKRRDAIEYFAVLVVTSRLKLGNDLRLLAVVVEADAQHPRGASIGAHPIDEPADFSPLGAPPGSTTTVTS